MDADKSPTIPLTQVPTVILSSNLPPSVSPPFPQKPDNSANNRLIKIISVILILIILITVGIIGYRYFFAKQYAMNAEYSLASGDYNQAKKLFIQAESLWENQSNKAHLAEIDNLLLKANLIEKSGITSTPNPTKSVLPSITSVPSRAPTPTILPEIANWKIFKSEKYGYSIRYPKDWVNYTFVNSKPTQAEENNHRFFNPISVRDPAVSIYVYIYTKQEFDYLQTSMKNYPIENMTQENITIDVFSGIKIKGKLQGNPGATAILTNKKYIFEISTEQGDYPTLFDNILLSLRETEVSEKTSVVNDLNSHELSGLSGSLFNVIKKTPDNKLTANIATTVENGLVVSVLDTKEEGDYLIVNIQFENTSTSSKEIKAANFQMHTKTKGIADDNGILSFTLSAKEKKEIEYKFLKLLDPPYEFWYLTANNNHLVLGIYNP